MLAGLAFIIMDAEGASSLSMISLYLPILVMSSKFSAETCLDALRFYRWKGSGGGGCLELVNDLFALLSLAVSNSRCKIRVYPPIPSKKNTTDAIPCVPIFTLAVCVICLIMYNQKITESVCSLHLC